MDGNVYIQQPDDTTLLPLLPLLPPQQLEVRGPQDDWRGLADSSERRKLQNRLNQRAWRRRKAKKRRTDESGVVPTNQEVDSNVWSSSCWPDALADDTSLGSMSNISDRSSESVRSRISDEGLLATQSAALCKFSIADIQRTILRFEESAHRDYILGSPKIDHLLTLMKFNVFQALQRNNSSLGFDMEWMSDDALSPFNKTDPQWFSLSCPPNLRPTSLQRAVQHHPWIDLFPIPAMRDNLLRAGDSFDDEQLCMDLVEFWNCPSHKSGLVVWGEPWDPSGWEVGENFLKKWAWVIKDCEGLFRSTNYWRTKRGEKKLFADIPDKGLRVVELT